MVISHRLTAEHRPEVTVQERDPVICISSLLTLSHGYSLRKKDVVHAVRQLLYLIIFNRLAYSMDARGRGRSFHHSHGTRSEVALAQYMLLKITAYYLYQI